MNPTNKASVGERVEQIAEQAVAEITAGHKQHIRFEFCRVIVIDAITRALSAARQAEKEQQTLGEKAVMEQSLHVLRNTFVAAFDQLAASVYDNAKSKGWWDAERNNGEMIALMHSELSEALEADRNGNPPDDKIPEFLGTEAELADVIIRIMDMAHARKWRVGEAVIEKMEMNKGRPYKHGRKSY